MYKEIDDCRYYEADYTPKKFNKEEVQAFTVSVIIIVALVAIWAVTHN